MNPYSEHSKKEDYPSLCVGCKRKDCLSRTEVVGRVTVCANRVPSLTKNLSTPESREFWRHAEESRKKVESWPKWKRNIKVTKF